MLQVQNIEKYYGSKNNVTKALDRDIRLWRLRSLQMYRVRQRRKARTLFF